MAAEGATYAIVPLVKKRVTGQIAGNVGAYGNVGAVIYLTIYSLLPEGVNSDRIFFQLLGALALVAAFVNAFFLNYRQYYWLWWLCLELMLKTFGFTFTMKFLTKLLS